MALVNPNIAMSFRQPEFRPRNAMAEYAQMQQIEGGQRQAEIADMQLEELRRDRDTLGQIQAAIVAKGGPADLGAAADAMLKSGNPKYFAQGLAIQETLKKQALLSRYESQYGGGAPAMPSSALGAMVAPAELAAGAQPESMAPVPGVISTSRVPGVVTAPITAPMGTMREIAPGGGMGAEMPLAPANALAPAAAAPVNAMVAAQPAAPASDVNALTRRYNMASMAGSPDAPVILEQIKAALKPDPSELRTMQQLGYPMTQEGYASFRAAQMKEAAPPSMVAEYTFAKTPDGGNFRGSYQDFVTARAAAGRAPATAARAAENAAPRKPMTELQQQAFRKGMAADKTGVKASQSVVNELEKLTDELVGNPEKKIAPHPGLSGITGVQAMLPSMPESLVTSGNSRKAQQRLETLKGKVMAFGRQLASLEGKLGNMAVQEWKFVSDSIQAIDPAAGNLDVQLRDIVRQAKNFANTVQERYDLTYEADGAPAEPTAAPTATPPRAGGNAPAAGGLSPAEQAELDQLRKRFRK